jgi:hypothetical protein
LLNNLVLVTAGDNLNLRPVGYTPDDAHIRNDRCPIDIAFRGRIDRHHRPQRRTNFAFAPVWECEYYSPTSVVGREEAFHFRLPHEYRLLRATIGVSLAGNILVSGGNNDAHEARSLRQRPVRGISFRIGTTVGACKLSA